MPKNVIAMVQTLLLLIALVYIGKIAYNVSDIGETLKTCTQNVNCSSIIPK